MKQKRLISFILTILMTVSLFSAYCLPSVAAVTVWDGSVASSFAAGSGSEEDPYIIRTAAQLAYLGQLWDGYDCDAAYVRLESDLYLNDTKDWEKWGNDEGGSIVAPANSWTPIDRIPFDGVFDGNGHTVYGMYVGGKIHDAGLFSTVSGTLMNLSIAESFVDGNYHAGAFCGNVDFKGNVVNCHNSGNVRGVYATGGIAGGHMAVQESFDINLVIGCTNSGNIFGQEYVGGIMGTMDEWVSRCHNGGTVTGERYVGGILGVGRAEMCYNSGTVSGNKTVGGISGSGHHVINCYNTAAVNGTEEVGGIVGVSNWGDGILNCYNVGRPMGTSKVGALAGELRESSAANSYCLDTVMQGIPEDQTVTAEQLSDQEFLNNWNFYSVWELGYHKDYDYPTLRFFGSQDYRFIFQKDSLGVTLAVDIVEDGATYTLAAPLHSEYEFLYWKSGKELYKAGTEIKACKDMIFTAYWAMPNTDAGVWQGEADTEFSGSGTQGDPYLITSAEELAGLSQNVAGGNTYKDRCIALTADLLLNDPADAARVQETVFCANEWTSIGTEKYHFEGTFDGREHSIKGLFMREGYGGLFAFNYGTVRNVKIENSYLSGEYSLGAVVAENFGLVENCHSSATVNALSYDERMSDGVGGVVGANGRYQQDGTATVKNCTNSGTVLLGDDYGSYFDVAGVVGYNNANVIACSNNGISKAGIVTYNDAKGVVRDCTNSGAVTGAGIVCYNEGVVIGCSNVADVRSDASISLAGIVSMNCGRVEECSNSGNISYLGTDNFSSAGGIVGDSGGTVLANDVIRCHNSGNISGSYNVGGIIGRANGNIEGAGSRVLECYNSGNVAGLQNVGGIAGEAATDYAIVQNCYNTGTVGGSTHVGGIAGYAKTVKNCYNVGALSGEAADPLVGQRSVPGTENNYTDLPPVMEGNFYLDSVFSGESSGGTPLSAALLTQKESFAEWNFDSVWELNFLKDYAYPTLRFFGSQEYFYKVILTEGDITLSETLYPKDSEITMTSSDLESEYDFAYWRNGDTRLKAGDTYTVTEDITLTAIRSVPNTTPGVWDGTADTSWEGSGTSGDPYLISTAEELAGMAERINDGNELNSHFRLTADILLNDGGELFGDTLIGKNEWTPIGADYEHCFRGGFDGDGYTVSGLYINGSDDYVGLFGEVQCDIKNLRIEDSYICGEYCIGAVMGKSGTDSKIINCYSNATVSGGYYVGGIVGNGSRTIIDGCINEGNVSGKTNHVAGIVGFANGLGIIKSVNRGQITGGGTVGGLVGNVSGQVSYMQQCSNSGDVTASGQYAGGLIGYSMSNTIQYSYNSGDVTGNSYVGGLVGQLGYNCTATCLYNCGTVTGETYVGGLLGGGTSSTLFNAYNVGDVLSPNAHDGILGKTGGVTVFNTNYKDTETSATAATALSDQQMRTEESYDFTFGSDWEFGGAYENYPYPTLTDTAHEIVDYKPYTVTFVDYNDEVLGTVSVSRHETATAPDTSDLWYVEGDYVHAFGYWDKQLTNVTESMTVKAVYQKTRIIGIVSESEEITVPRGFSKENLRTLLESRYSKMICMTDGDFHVISDITWDIAEYDPNGADTQIFFGTLALTDTPYYKLLDPHAPFGIAIYLSDDIQDNTFKAEELSYTVNPDGTSITVTGYSGTAGEIVIPAVIDGYQVTAIGEEAFYNSNTTQSVLLPNTVKSIADKAFASNPNLVEVVLPEGLERIGINAFSNTGLTDITLPDSLKSIAAQSLGYNNAAKQPGFVIYAYEGSAGEVYAQKNGFELITLQKLKDQQSGITVDADGALKLAVLAVPEGDYFDTAASIAPDAAVSLYEITLRDEKNNETQPGSMITISIPVPDGMTGSACSVYRINSDGSYEDMNAALKDGRLIFTTAHLSFYAVVDDLLPAPTVLSKTDRSVTLQTQSGYEYKYEGGLWQTNGTFTGLKAGVTYSFLAREIVSGKESGAVMVTTIKPAPAAPAAPTLASKTKTSVTLNKVKGCEYRCDNGAWQYSTTFTGLQAGKTYTFYQRYAATDTTLAGKVSKGLKVTTNSNTLVFTDVKKNDYFYDAVAWAVELGVTTGTSPKTFGPNESCTRAQAVTFLWRAAGQPTAKNAKNPFADVKKSDYYYKAVLWAAENGVTSGTSATKFSPNDTCTRGQIVTFLWRAQSGKKVSAKNPFKDVKKSDFYYNAVLWAVKNGVTTGTSPTTFGPSENCTRGQIVTFLNRAVN